MKLIILTIIFLLSSSIFANDLVNVGVTTIDITPPIGTPLAGYGQPKRRMKGFLDWGRKYPYATFFAPSQGVLDPINVRTMVVEKNGKRVAFVSLDVVGITSDFVKSLAKRLKKLNLGIDRKNLFVSGTHTHSGPGALTRRFSLAILAVDIFNKSIFNFVMDRVVQSIKDSISNSEESYLYNLTFKTSNLQNNRGAKPGFYDANARLLIAKNLKGDWLGGIVNYAIHGTALSGKNMKLSADMPGAIATKLEEALTSKNYLSNIKPTMVFINGAEGDVSPRVGGEVGMKQISESFANQTLKALSKAKLIIEPEINYKRKNVWVGFPSFNIKACIENKKLRKFISKYLAIPITPLMPLVSSISYVKIGNVMMLSWPGEPTTQLGYDLRLIAKSFGNEHAWILGLTNDYLAYFVTKDEFKNGGYQACTSLYNYRGGRRILKGYKKLLGAQ